MNARTPDNQQTLTLSRRRLLAGAATLGAGSALGWPGRAGAVTAGE
ncbi:MAG: twin-arginine translocation signal domain-containing protein, partial [Alphaproteobacteria bacterium]